MRFAVYVHGEKLPFFTVEANSWGEGMKEIGDELERRMSDPLRGRHRGVLGGTKGGSRTLGHVTVWKVPGDS